MSGIDIGPKIGIEGEKQFKDAIKAVNSQIKTTASSLKVLAAESEKSEDKAKNLSDRQKALGESLDANKTKIKTLTAQYDRQKSKLDELDTALEKARKENGEGSEEAVKAENAYSKQAKAVSDLETQINTAKVQIANISGELETNAVKLQEARSRAIKYGDAMKAAGDKISGIGTKISQAGGALTLGITTPLVAAGTASVKFATDAETSFGKVSTIADTSVLSMDKIKAGALEMSNTTGVAVTDFNEALYQTISATGDTANAIDYTTIAAKAAKGGFTDTATAVDGLTTIMNSYGLKGSEAMQMVSDQMLMAQNYGKTTFGELASSMGQVVPIASQLNIGTDTLLATMATLTKNGIGTSQAVTGMKAALSNVIKPSSEASKAAAVLGLDFSAAALQSKGFAGFMGDVKSALENAAPEYANLVGHLEETKDKMADLEDAGQKNTAQYKALQKESKATEKSLETIAGAADSPIAGFSTLFGSVEGLNSMLVLASETGGKDFEGALQAMADSSGATQSAFDKMDSTPAAQMQKELNKLKNTGIETGNKLLPIVTKAVEGAGKLLDAYNDLDDGTKDLILRTAGIAAAAGPALKITGTATKGIGKLTSGVGGLVKDMGKLSSAKKAAQAIGEVGSKSLKSVEGVSGFSKVLFKLASPGGIALTAAGILAGVGVAFLKIRDDAIKADIAAHFGNVKLSAEEVEDVAKRLTTTDWTIKLELYSNAKEELDGTFENLETAKATLEKETWKVRVGMELSGSDREGYISAIDNYVRSAIATVEQASYTAQISIDAVLAPGTTANTWVTQFSQAFYSESNAELTKLGNELAETVDKALGDNLLTDEELININDLQSRMQVIMDKISERQYKVELAKIQIGTKGEGLSAESFQDLINQLNEQTQARLDSAEGIEAEVMVDLEAMLENGQITQSAYGLWIKQAELSVAGNNAKILAPAIDLEVETINTNFGTEIESVKKACQFDIDTAFNSLQVGDNWQQALSDAIVTGFSSIDPITAEAMKGFVTKLSPQKEDLEALRDKYIEAGEVPPSSITEGLNDLYQLEQISGAADNTLALLAQSIAESPENQTIIANSLKAGSTMDSSLAQALRDNYGLVWNATAGMFEQVQQASFVSQDEAIKFMNSNGIAQGTALASSIANQYGLVFNATTGMWEAVDAATSSSSAGANAHAKGQEIGAAQGQGIAEGATSQTENVQSASGELVASSEDGIEAALPEAEKTATEGGKGIGEDLADGIESTETQVDASAADLARSAAQEMQLTINGISLDPPTMKTPDWTPIAELGRTLMQNYLNNNPLSVTVNPSPGSVAYHAAGGIFTTPHLAMVAEEPAGEAIIPLSASRRADAVDILAKTAEIIGYDAYSYAADAGRSAGASRARPQKSPAPKQTVYRFEEGAIQTEIHTRATNPEEIYRVVSRKMEQDVKRMVKGHGGI